MVAAISIAIVDREPACIITHMVESIIYRSPQSRDIEIATKLLPSSFYCLVEKDIVQLPELGEIHIVDFSVEITFFPD